MKTLTMISTTVLFIGLAVFAQDSAFVRKWYAGKTNAVAFIPQELRIDVRGKYRRPVKKEKLCEARLLGDFIAGYPVNWISHYASVEIQATCHGKVRKALSADNHLSATQKEILNTVDPGTDIIIDVMYIYQNPVTNIAEDNGMYVVLTLIPDNEAEYVGGYSQMIKYLKESIERKISKNVLKEFQQGIVDFTVNGRGEITHVKTAKPSGDAKTDKLLIEIITNMPKWKPAENSNGIKVKQEFEFEVNAGMDGC